MTEIERVEKNGHRWVATVRFEHRFESVDDADRPWETNEDILSVAQGAVVRRGRKENGEALVYQVSVPDAPMRGETEVEKLAKAVTRKVEK